MNERTEVVRKSWDPTWESIFATRGWGKYPPEYVIRFIAQNWYGAADRSAIRILDLGSGPGACSWYMAREGFTVSAVDGAPTAIKQLTQRLEAEQLHADARVGDYINLPWQNQTFDAVVDNVSLYGNSFLNCLAVVAEVSRVLKSGGLFLSANFTPNTWGFGLGCQIGKNEFVDITEGPLAGKGTSLFMDSSQAELLYSGFDEVSTDFLTYTMNGGRYKVQLRIVTCKKA